MDEHNNNSDVSSSEESDGDFGTLPYMYEPKKPRLERKDDDDELVSDSSRDSNPPSPPPPSQNNDEIPSVENFCTCDNCIVMSSAVECVCCQSDGFKNIVLRQNEEGSVFHTYENNNLSVETDKTEVKCITGIPSFQNMVKDPEIIRTFLGMIQYHLFYLGADSYAI